ncbi:autoinducer-2 kinase [Roseicitreum antarcticum]|uniref:Autoinducer 2 (AI-2) kinase n=1 Tax=Roseicitreum antarcticum TaxID=564137 RepID=A0A1H2Z445_9RHOB|nr:autoinducer-2 kinase [Roseicitreum antarcticum]SDX12202.1 autoinducer 2 (AI-2) kinase [Roseicitreum antarcticum]
MPQYYLAIDAGTGSGRAVIFDQTGAQCGLGQEEWTHTEEADVPGSMAFDTSANWALLCRCIRQAVAGAGVRADQICAISTTAMREGIVLYDAAGAEIWACANVDGRATAEVAALKARDPGLERAFYRISGQTFALGAWPRLEWLRHNRPGLFARAARLSMINDWIAARLSGEIVVEPSNAGTTGLMDATTRQWSDDLIRRAGLPRSLFPDVVEPGSRIGPVTAQAADATGLAQGTPVFCGGGDVQMGTLGLGLTGDGDAAVLGGSFWQQIINIPAGRTDDTMRVRINPHVIGGLNQAECISFFVGLTMRWFRDTFCAAEMAEAKARGIDVYAYLEELAAQVPPGSNGIIPIFSDAMDFGQWYHAAPSFLNMSIEPGHTTRASLFRALEENAAIVSSINLERVITFSGVSIEKPVIFAGGASKGALWAQILANVLGREVALPKVREATALGCAAVAAYGTGAYASLAEAGAAMAGTERVLTPDPALAGVYRDARARWEAAYPAQKQLADRNITTSMWRAPGV